MYNYLYQPILCHKQAYFMKDFSLKSTQKNKKQNNVFNDLKVLKDSML